MCDAQSCRGLSLNVRSPENVADELAWLKRTYQPDHIWFADDILGLKPGWIQRFANLVETHDARVPFKSLNRPDLLLKGDTAESHRARGLLFRRSSAAYTELEEDSSRHPPVVHASPVEVDLGDTVSESAAAAVEEPAIDTRHGER